MSFLDKLKDRLFYKLSALSGRFVRKVKIQKGVRLNSATILAGNNRIGARTQIIGSTIGEFSYIGKDSKLNHVSVGRFCSIGSNIRTGLGIHPTSGFVSTHPMFFSVNNVVGESWVDRQKFKEHKYAKKGYYVEIKNDVWIGDNVIIMDGVVIGNGAIVAAGSIVTKDVEDFQIVGGVPARMIKHRFNENDRTFILNSKWWDFDLKRLKSISGSFENVELFKNSVNET